MNSNPSTEKADFAADVQSICSQVSGMLIAKNNAYGNSALDPIRCFFKSDTTEQIRVRIDDKLSRIQRGQQLDEDVVMDLIGYLVILRIAEKRSESQSARASARLV